MNKRKIFNDPVYGFITIHSDLIFDIIESPEFQRLRRIKQMGLADFVYPGALHTRFHHAIGAMHLMGRALQNLREKGNHISDSEYESALIAILLHDVGHGPFSHTLEQQLLKGVAHEELSLLIMKGLNKLFNGDLSLAISMFTGDYDRPFFHQLISSQLDIDRLDYLKRDSFFTGVSEGTIGSDRIVKLLSVADNRLVVEEKGIYSIEHFLNARRLMYWQVYLHKTGVAADTMLKLIIKRAKVLALSNDLLSPSEDFLCFLKTQYALKDFKIKPGLLNRFTAIDDYDIWSSLKLWQKHSDKILAFLCNSLLNRRLFKIQLSDSLLELKKQEVTTTLLKQPGVSLAQIDYLVDAGSISNKAYMANDQKISIIHKNGQTEPIEQAADLPNIKAMSKIVSKNYLCWANHVSL